jgi:hypothetical protein
MKAKSRLYTDKGYLFRTFLHYIIIAISGAIIGSIAGLAFLFTYEPNTKNTVTKRKVKRIIFFTKLKLWFYHHTSGSAKFLNDYVYLKGIHKRFDKTCHVTAQQRKN